MRAPGSGGIGEWAVRVLVVVVAVTACGVFLPVVASGHGGRERGSGVCGYVYPAHNGYSPYGVGKRYLVQTTIAFSCAVARRYVLRLAVEKPVGAVGKLSSGPPGYACYGGSVYPQEAGGCLKKPLGSSGLGFGWESR
jgi:hypothetical protein